jgi:hypothetical protein
LWGKAKADPSSASPLSQPAPPTAWPVVIATEAVDESQENSVTVQRARQTRIQVHRRRPWLFAVL